MNTVRTIGYEGAILSDFLATLEMAGVSVVVDIREIPVSRRKGFSKKALAEALRANGIEYVHIPALGDPKEGREAARDGRMDEFRKVFLKHLLTDEARVGLSQLSVLVADKSACLLCYERDPLSCHRLLVAKALSDILPVQVKHLGVRDGIGNAREGRAGEGACAGKGAAPRQ